MIAQALAVLLAALAIAGLVMIALSALVDFSARPAGGLHKIRRRSRRSRLS